MDGFIDEIFGTIAEELEKAEVKDDVQPSDSTIERNQ